MRLNLPILDLLDGCQNILIAGGGGGYDIFSGLPIYFTLRELGKTVHLANLSFSDFSMVSKGSRSEQIIPETLMVTYGDIKYPLPLMAEAHLSAWFKQTRGEDVPIWLLCNRGGKPLTAAYAALCQRLKIDAILLIDGGVDSLMRGDESGAGTLIEDTLTLAAIRPLTHIRTKIQMCVGFGTEVEEAVCHYNALENMAALVKAGAFYGSCALTPQMPCFTLYEQACRHVWETPGNGKSHIATRIIPAVHGEFGNHHMYAEHENIRICVSPLMSLYWFFDAHTLMQHSHIIDLLADTEEKRDAIFVVANAIRRRPNLRPARTLPY
jgi:hypothetical protein